MRNRKSSLATSDFCNNFSGGRRVVDVLWFLRSIFWIGGTILADKWLFFLIEGEKKNLFLNIAVSILKPFRRHRYVIIEQQREMIYRDFTALTATIRNVLSKSAFLFLVDLDMWNLSQVGTLCSNSLLYLLADEVIADDTPFFIPFSDIVRETLEIEQNKQVVQFSIKTGYHANFNIKFKYKSDAKRFVDENVTKFV